MSLQEYLAIFLRRKWMIVFTILTILFGASVYCVVTPEKFRSSTTILVVPQRVPEGYVKSTVSIKIEERLATIQQQVMSRTRLVTVMDELGLFKELRKSRPIEEVVDMMRKRIEIQVGAPDAKKRRDAESDSFTLSFVHENRQTAMLTASRLASFFIDENLKSREQQAVGTSEFLDSQLQETKGKLEAAEAKVRQYKMQFMGELPQQMQANLAVLSRLQEQLRANADATRTAEDRRVFLTSQIASLESHIREFEKPAPQTVNVPADSTPEATAVANPELVVIDPAHPQTIELAAKQSKLAELSNRYTDSYPEVVRVKREIEQLERRIVEIRKTAPSPANAVPSPVKKGASPPRVTPAAVTPSAPRATKERDELRLLKAQLASVEADIPQAKRDRQELLRAMAVVEAKVGQSPRREQEMISLSRDYDNLKASYDELLKKKLDADVSQNLEKRQKGEQFQILDPANLPEEPFVPDRKKIMGIAALAAFALAFGGTLLLEITNPALRTAHDFKHIYSFPVLASVPQIQDGEYAERRKMHQAAVFGGIALFLVSVCGFLLLFGDRIRTILSIGGGN
jgi:polysaccharide chain length determinant protein (PEP-CTERM system associated)